MKKVQIVLLLGGGILFAMLVRRTGVDAIAGQVAQTGWTFLWVLGCDLLLETLHTIGWRHCFLPEERKIPWFDFFLCRKAGVAVNVLTPTATMGGEAVKAMLVRRWVSFREGIASVVVDKLAFAIGQAIFLAAGLVPLFALVLESPRQRLVASLFMALWVSGLVAFWWLQRRGLFGRGLRAFRKLLRVAADNGLPERAEALDERIVCFFAGAPGRARRLCRDSCPRPVSARGAVLVDPSRVRLRSGSPRGFRDGNRLRLHRGHPVRGSGAPRRL